MTASSGHPGAPEISQPRVRCHLCGFDGAEEIDGFARFHRVTSDCKPWPPGGRLAVCCACDSLQMVTDPAWHRACAQIYRDYTVYHQSQGAEQSVFDQTKGTAGLRSTRLLERVLQEVPLPAEGRLLDIGCGNGALLRAFGALRPGWRLAGVEVNDRNRQVVEAIPGVEKLHVGTPAGVPGRFHCISLVHTLEHIAHPQLFLEALRDKLEPGGRLLVQVPDCEANPFMLLVADHATHFFPDSLRTLVERSGYAVVAAANQWVAKELTVVAQPTTAPPTAIRSAAPAPSTAAKGDTAAARNRLAWLHETLVRARKSAEQGRFGIFGTSIAGTWLGSELGDAVEYFVDEDPNRAGRSHLGRPVLTPTQVPAGSSVFLGLPPVLARSVAERIRRPDVQWVLPPVPPE